MVSRLVARAPRTSTSVWSAFYVVHRVELGGSVAVVSRLVARAPHTLVEEVNLTVNISALRKALDGGPDGVELIQTVPTRGYRFVGKLNKRDAAVALELRDPSSELRTQRSDGKHRQLIRSLTNDADAYRAYQQGRHE